MKQLASDRGSISGNFYFVQVSKAEFIENLISAFAEVILNIYIWYFILELILVLKADLSMMQEAKSYKFRNHQVEKYTGIMSHCH